MAAVHQHQQFHGAGAAVVQEGLQGGPDSASGKEYVVHQDDHAAVHIFGDAGPADVGLAFKACPVVAVEIDVQSAQGHGAAQAVPQKGGQAAGQVCAPAFNAHQHDLVAVGVAFPHLRSQAVQNAGDFLLVQQGDGGHGSSGYAPAGYVIFSPKESPCRAKGRRAAAGGGRWRAFHRLTSPALELSYKDTRNMEDVMIELSESARKELDAFFADKKKDPIRVYMTAG